MLVVYTRNGGGNRDEYQPVIDELKKHPLYLRDYDDDFDCTYCCIEFAVPDDAKVAVKEFLDKVKVPEPMERFQKLVDDMKDGKENDETKKALDVGKKIFGKIDEMPNGGVIEV